MQTPRFNYVTRCLQSSIARIQDACKSKIQIESKTRSTKNCSLKTKPSNLLSGGEAGENKATPAFSGHPRAPRTRPQISTPSASKCL